MIRIALVALAAAGVLCALFFARPHATPGPPMRDFEAYYAAGVAWQHGMDPYGTRIWDIEKTLAGVSPARVELLPFVGPPATLPLWSLLAHLSFERANVVWRAVLVFSLVGLIVVALRLGGRKLQPLTFITLALFSLGFGPLTSAVALGQVALPAFACAAIALLWPPAGILAWAQPNVAIVLFSQVLRRRGAIAFVAGLTIFVLGCAAIAGWHGLLAYVQLLHAHEQAERFSVIQLTPAAIAFGLGASAHVAALLAIVVATAVIVAWGMLMQRVRDRIGQFCATCTVLPLVMPFFHEHDMLVLFLPSIYFTLQCSARTWPLAAAGALLCATDWLGLAQRPDGALQTLLLAGSAGIALVALRRDARPTMFIVPAGVLALIAIAAIIAQTHPAPIWPDAMHTLSGGMLSADAAHVWHEEQQGTGLFAQNAFWALLRALSLLGTLSLIAAAFLHAERRLAPSAQTMVLTPVR